MPPINAAQAFNLPKDVSFGPDLVFSLYELDCNDMAEFEAWANGVLLGQFEELWKTLGPLLAMAVPKSADDPAALAVIEALKFMERVAADRTRTYFQIGSEETSALLMTWVGARELLYLSIKHGKPDFTRTEARELFAKCSPSFVLSIPELVGLVATAAEMEGRPDPKAGSSSGAGPTPGETPSSTDGDTPRESTSSA